MNITPSLIYWITRLDAVIVLGVIAIILSLLASIVIGIGYSVVREENGKEKASVLIKPLKTSIGVLVISTIVAVLVPSSKEGAAMIVIPRVANSESVKDIGTESSLLRKSGSKS